MINDALQELSCSLVFNFHILDYRIHTIHLIVKFSE